MNECLLRESDSFKLGGGGLGWEKSTEASTGGFLLSVVTIVDNSNLILDRLWRSSGVVKA